MRKSKKIEDIWAQVPPDYYEKGIKKNILQRIWHTKKFSTLKSIIDSKISNNILDVGCASGSFTNNISNIFPNSTITGIDIYSSAIEYGKKKYPHINFILADAHHIPFEDNRFDLVICYETIEHLTNPLEVLREMRRVLKTEGTAIVAMDSGSLLFQVVWFLWEKTKGNVWQGAHIHPYDHKELESVIKKAGFKIKNKRFSHLGMEVSFLLKK